MSPAPWALTFILANADGKLMSAPELVNMAAAIHIDRCSCDITRERRGQEKAHTCDILRLGDAPERHRSDNLRPPFIAQRAAMDVGLYQ